MNDHNDMDTAEKVGYAAGGCLVFLIMLAICASVLGGIVYVVAVLLFGADMSFLQCCGIGLVLGMFLGSGR